MLRGINRQIIEVNETGHPYFERAFLIVRPDCEETEEGDGLRREAGHFVASAGAYHGLKLQRRKHRFSQVVSWLSMGIVGAAGGFLCGLLLR